MHGHRVVHEVPVAVAPEIGDHEAGRARNEDDAVQLPLGADVDGDRPRRRRAPTSPGRRDPRTRPASWIGAALPRPASAPARRRGRARQESVASTLRKVIAVGNQLTGKVVAWLRLGRDGLVGSRLGFTATFADGSEGVFATEVDASLFSFTGSSRR